LTTVADEASGQLVAGRTCENCTLCCKLLEVEPLEKPRAVWCPHCDQKHGCKIYERRPEACRSFYCGYRRIETIDDRWKPSKAKFLINYEEAANRIVLHVDPARPDAWRTEPYYSMIKQWSRRALAEHGMVLVWTGSNATIVFPDRDKNLGHVRDDQFIVPIERMTPLGREIDFEVADAPQP
jgi:hypothetical protein